MDVTVSSSNPASSCKNEADQRNARPLANFHPTVWGDFFVINSSLASENQIDHAQMQQRVEMLKEQVRTMFSTSSSTTTTTALEEEMKLVDALQRLGLAYHFEKEIGEALARIHASHQYSTVAASEDLHFVSLRFRLLRRGGYNVSSNEFNKFKDAHGHFKGSLSSDIESLLSLYEASNCLGTREEDGILEEAMSFCRRDLQALYQGEVRVLTRWWKEIGLIEKLNFARDRLVECYVWMVGMKYEPHLAHARMMMTKVICLASVLDDIYDSYGTLEELRLLTDVMQRWDIGEVQGLPEYMKTYFMALSDTIKEFEQQYYHVQYLKEEFKTLSKHYFKEAEWCNVGHTPTLQDHLQVSLTSGGAPLLICGFFVGMGDVATEHFFENWFASNPKIIEASSLVTRLIGDVASHEFEANRQHVATTVHCYMKDYGVSKETAYQRLREMGDTAWKVMNEEWIKSPTQIPRQPLTIPYNFARMVELYYKGYDGYVLSSWKTKDLITLLLVKHIPL